MYQTDDAARRLKNVWKGNEHMTLPFDARFGAWVAAALIAPPATLGAWTATRAFREGGPAGFTLLAVVVTAVSVYGYLRVRGRIPGRRSLAMLGAAPLLMQALAPAAMTGGPGGALFSVSSAAAIGVGGTILVIRKFGRNVDAVTPLRYQAAVIAAEARAPRDPQPTTRTVTAPRDVTATDVTATRPTAPRAH